MDANGGNARRLTTNEVAEREPLVSPDGTQVLFTADANERFEPYYNDKLFVVPAGGGTARVLLPDVPYEVTSAQWTPDGTGVVFVANHGVHTQVMQVQVATRRVTALTSGDHTVGAWRMNPRSGAQVFTVNTTTRPGEVYLLTPGASMRQVTHAFDFVGRQYLVARQEKLTWKGQDGQAVEGVLYYPVNHRPGRLRHLRLLTRSAGLRRQGLRGAAAQLSRQHGLRRRVPAPHGAGLFQAGAPRRAGGRRCGHRARPRALKYNGVPTRLWVAPREGHGWSELRHVLFRVQVELEWFQKWLSSGSYSWESAPGDVAAAPTQQ